MTLPRLQLLRRCLDSLGLEPALWSLRVRRSPSMVSSEAGQDIYLVLDDFGGRLGRAWRETAEEDANHEMLIRDLMDDRYSHPLRIIAFDTAEGWSRDVTLDIADELRRHFAECDEVPASVQELARR